MIAAIVRRLRRAAAKRDVRYWGNWIEELDRRHKSHDADMARAVAECHKAKRTVSACDIASIRRVSFAPGNAPSDGIARFSLLDEAR